MRGAAVSPKLPIIHRLVSKNTLVSEFYFTSIWRFSSPVSSIHSKALICICFRFDETHCVSEREGRCGDILFLETKFLFYSVSPSRNTPRSVAHEMRQMLHETEGGCIEGNHEAVL